MPPKSRGTPIWFGDGPVRLQRVLAAAGYGSRRGVEELIETGRVEVDGEVVNRLGATVNPSDCDIRVDGESLRSAKAYYYAVNKPTGVVTTNRDPQGRPRVVDLAPPDHRVFPVGRLDQHSEGLILLTNDGWLAERLAHPRYGVEKVYQVTIAGTPPPDFAKKLVRGIHLAETVVRAKRVRIRSSHGRSTELEMTLDEGKNREIRRMMARLGNKVMRLRRVAFGPLKLGELPLGACRPLTSDEIQKLRTVASTKRKKIEPNDDESSKGRRGPKKSAIARPRKTVIGGDDEIPAPRRSVGQRSAGLGKGKVSSKVGQGSFKTGGRSAKGRAASKPIIGGRGHATKRASPKTASSRGNAFKKAGGFGGRKGVGRKKSR